MCCLGSAAFAQSTGTATIAGSIQDASGAIVPGASVVATHLATGITRDTVTNERGYYVLPALPIGKYDWSLNVFKNTRVRWFGSGTATAQIGAEFFNVFNHPQFEDVGTFFGTATFGRVLSARDPRIVQLRMKLIY